MQAYDSSIIGIDEVGYGSFAGSLYICALKFHNKPDFDLFDSKKISYLRRNKLFEQIIGISTYKIGIATVEEINTLGLSAAYKLALKRAVDNFDGNFYMDGKTRSDISATFVVKGDSQIMQIAAASIVAKVLRDTYMENLSAEYKKYHFDQHKGYGTKLHREKIKEFGFCDLHRTSYNISKYLQ